MTSVSKHLQKQRLPYIQREICRDSIQIGQRGQIVIRDIENLQLRQVFEGSRCDRKQIIARHVDAGGRRELGKLFDDAFDLAVRDGERVETFPKFVRNVELFECRVPDVDVLPIRRVVGGWVREARQRLLDVGYVAADQRVLHRRMRHALLAVIILIRLEAQLGVGIKASTLVLRKLGRRRRHRRSVRGRRRGRGYVLNRVLVRS